MDKVTTMVNHEEQRRLDALRRYAIIDTPPEPNFDRITKLAAQIFEHPICTLALADRDRFWFKSHHGVDATEMPRRMAFCEQTIGGDDVFVVPDAFEDSRFAAAPVVSSAPHLRFYAGAPLVTPAGVRIGSLCVLDPQPQPTFSESRKQILNDLACTAVELLEARSRQIILAETSEEIAFLARHDPLTGLANRTRLAEVANDTVEHMNDGDTLTLLYLDLDGFKAVNDTHGHHCGDSLLIAVARRLEAALPKGTIVARLGGDEFVIVLKGFRYRRAAEFFAERLIKLISADYQLAAGLVRIGVSIGIASGQGTKLTLDALMREADRALYLAKAQGRGCHATAEHNDTTPELIFSCAS